MGICDVALKVLQESCQAHGWLRDLSSSVWPKSSPRKQQVGAVTFVHLNSVTDGLISLLH